MAPVLEIKFKNDVESNKVQKATENRSLQLVRTIFNVLNHSLIVVVVLYMSVLCYRMGNRSISWHIWLCTIGYQLLMTEAILSFYAHNIWSKSLSRATQRTIHWTLQVVGSAIASFGIIFYYVCRDRESKPHFISIHSIFGTVAGCFTFISLFNGISALWSIEMKNYVRPVCFKFFHSFSGIVTFVLGMITLALGYDRHYMQHHSREDIRMWLQVFAILTILLSLFGAIRTSMHHLRNILIN